MKHIFCFAWLLIPSLCFAQIPSLGVYADDRASYCSIADAPGPHTLYVLGFASDATGATFRIEYSSGFTGTLLSSASPWTNLSGNPITGVSVMFDNTCQTGQFPVMTLNFMFMGSSPNCSWIRIAALPDAPIMYDCNFAPYPAFWAGTHISSIFECPNNLLGPPTGPPPWEPKPIEFCRPYWEPTVATSATTWGAVKALYR